MIRRVLRALGRYALIALFFAVAFILGNLGPIGLLVGFALCAGIVGIDIARHSRAPPTADPHTPPRSSAPRLAGRRAILTAT